MSTLVSLARAQAVDVGRAQPVATVRHVHLSGRPMMFVPLALAGEACAPLAAMVGDHPRAPQLLVVTQPRNRTQRFGFAAELADIVVPYIEGYLGDVEILPGSGRREPRTRCADAPQILMPNRAGVSFARLLGRSTRFRRAEGDYAVPATVPVLGRWLTFLAERAEYPGSCLMLAATDMLTMHWATGQSPVEDLNLAALLGWIDPPDGRTGPEAALAAEDPVRWPPAGPATDPTFDNEVLARLIAAGNQAAASGDDRAERRARVALEQALASQLAPTWRLLWRAADLLRGLPPGGHVAARWDADKDAVTWHAGQLRDGGPPQPRRDSAVTAARRLARLERVQAACAAQRAFDDPLVMAEHRLTGEAFAGEVVAVEPGRLDTSGRRAKLRPRVTVRTWDPVLVDEGAALISPARPRQDARVVSVANAADGQPAQVVLELAGGMGHGRTAPAGTIPEVGDFDCYATFSDGYQPPPAFPELEQTPWTHGGPPVPYQPVPYQPTDEEAQEEWS
ncbi:MAG TPA: hypothetical protein VNF47_03360 [Streptosporangiaceae bacterium]|nr:hypothetical protein [Streptosporangiaceae bacterium]